MSNIKLAYELFWKEDSILWYFLAGPENCLSLSPHEERDNSVYHRLDWHHIVPSFSEGERLALDWTLQDEWHFEGNHHSGDWTNCNHNSPVMPTTARYEHTWLGTGNSKFNTTYFVPHSEHHKLIKADRKSIPLLDVKYCAEPWKADSNLQLWDMQCCTTAITCAECYISCI